MRLCLTAIAATLTLAAPVAAAPSGYGVTGSIPGPDGSWDYASVDAKRRRLYVAHGQAITAFDLATGAVTPTLAPASRPHEVLPLPGTDLLLATDGGTGTARLLDATSGAERGRIAVGKNPDAAIWDARRKHVIVMNAESGTISIVDPQSAKVVGTVALAEGLEFAAIDKAGRLFVNNEDRNQIAVVDLDHLSILGWIDLKGCEGPTGMAYAPVANRIVSACANGVVAIVDPVTRKLEGTQPIGRGADAVILDSTRNRLFVPSGGAGTLSVFADTPKGLQPLQTVKTETSARTGAVDPVDGKIYLPAATMIPATQPGGRRQRVPGTFHLIVVAPQ